MANTKTDNKSPDITKSEVIRRLKEIYRSEEYIRLQQKLSQDTYLSSISKANSETAFSSFICWMLNNEIFKNLPDPPLMNLLRILAHNAVLQEEESQDKVTLIDVNLINKIMSNSISIISSYAETEISTKPNENYDKAGKIDIIVYATIMVNPGETKEIRVLLENKVYSVEHDNQCTNYYNFFSNQQFQNAGVTYEDIYCFLAIDKNIEVSDKHFIKFNYQELLDSVLIPLVNYKQFIPQNLYFYITDFIDTLTTIKTDQKPQIAMTEEIRALLKSFYEKNNDLIRAAILESDDEEVKSAIEKSTRKRNSPFEISCGQSKETVEGYQLLVYKIIRYLASKKTSTDIIDTFKKLGKIFGSKYLVSDRESDYIDGKGTVRHLHKAGRNPIECTDNKVIYCSGQLTEDNVKAFIKFINENQTNLGVKITPKSDDFIMDKIEKAAENSSSMSGQGCGKGSGTTPTTVITSSVFGGRDMITREEMAKIAEEAGQPYTASELTADRNKINDDYFREHKDDLARISPELVKKIEIIRAKLKK